MKKQSRRIKLLLSAIVLATASLLPGLISNSEVHAAQITARSLTLQTGTTPSDVNLDSIDDGGSMPGGTANHLMQFTVPSSTSVDAILFQYCTTAAPVSGGIQCDAPTNMDATGADVGLNGGTDWTITNQTASTVTMSGTATDLSGVRSFRLDDVINTDDLNTTFFIRMTTYTGGTGGTAVDAGTVAASTADPVVLSGDMPESLVFCTGETISAPGGIPDCTTATTANVAFDKLFTPVDTAFALSQMAASTNAGSGYAITAAGPTLTSGANTIGAIGGTAEAPILGKVGGQFGLNLVENTVGGGYEIVGSADVAPAANAVNYFGQALTNFNTDSSFAFDATGLNTVANSNSTGSDSQIFTVSYIVNVPGSQPAGTYSTTLTYICTPTF